MSREICEKELRVLVYSQIKRGLQWHIVGCVIESQVLESESSVEVGLVRSHLECCIRSWMLEFKRGIYQMGRAPEESAGTKRGSVLSFTGNGGVNFEGCISSDWVWLWVTEDQRIKQNRS